MIGELQAAVAAIGQERTPISFSAPTMGIIWASID